MKKSPYNSTNQLFFLFTCVKDGRKYISKLFDSLLKQSKVNFVHYIYEDGSGDPVEDLVNDYKERSSKLKNPIVIIYEKNKTNVGLNMSTKHCIEHCNKPYFLWLNCDDWVDCDFFENLEKNVLKNERVSVFVSKMRVHFNGNFYFIPRNQYEKRLIQSKDYKRLFLSNNVLFNYCCIKYDDYINVNKNVFFYE